jgi:hypothetical protein
MMPVGELGLLLELLHDADARRQTLQAEFRGWAALPADKQLGVQFDDQAPGRLRWRGGSPWPRTVQDRRRLWLESPDRLRVELLRGGELVRVGLRVGPRWWRWDQQGGESAGSLDQHPQLPPLLDPPQLSPARLIGWLRIEPTGVGERAGRRVLTAHGFPRAARPSSDVRFALEFDAEYGTLIRRARLHDGRCVQLTEAIEIRYDLPLDPSRFGFPPPQQTSWHRPAAPHSAGGPSV